MAEQLICNQQVVGSTPTVGSLLTMYLDVADIGIIVNLILYGWIPEWPKGTDCKSAGTAFEGSNPSPPILHSTDLLAVKQYLGCAKYMLCIKIQKSRCGGTGRRTGLKILRDLYSHTGSIPVAGILIKSYT